MNKPNLKHRIIAFLCIFVITYACSKAAAQQNGSSSEVCTLDRATGTTIDKEPFLRNAYGTHWNFKNNLIVFMQPNDQGYYHLYTISPEGGSPKALLPESRPDLPENKHEGVPHWHPSGRYIMFQAEKSSWKGGSLFGVPDYGALPGFGTHDDLWLMTADGNHIWQLTNDPDTKDQGILIPIFSPDGRHIAWSSRQPGKLSYIIKVADFVEKPEPHLENIKSYMPGGKPYYYEPGDFSSDGQYLTYTSDQDSHSFWNSQIYLLDLASGQSKRLTNDKYYNEHPVVVKTPTGDWVVYMTTKGAKRRAFSISLGTDWYAMKLDGSGQKPLTTMNAKSGKDNPEDAGYVQWAGRVSISPAGDLMLGDAQDSLTKQTGLVRVVHFTCDE